MANKIKCIVTGGAGFIGSHLVDKLLSLGHEVIVIDNFSSGKRKNLKQHKNNPNLKIIKKDICDESISPLFKNASFVFHLAAIPNVQFSINFPKKTNKINILGTLNVLEAAKKNGVKRVIFSSSSAIYGTQDKSPLVESVTPKPMSPYALQKLTGEYYCKLYNLLFGMETICLRYFNVYGPRQDPSGGYAGLIPKTINRILNNKKPEIYGDGEQTRDFIYVKDVIDANISVALTKNKKSFGQIFNVGSGKESSVKEIIKLITGNKKILPRYKPPLIEPRESLADIKKIKKMIGWKPKVKFKEGIRETIEWYGG